MVSTVPVNYHTKVTGITLAASHDSGKEFIMTNNTYKQNHKSMMGSYYYFYFKACFFAGLFRRAKTLLSYA